MKALIKHEIRTVCMVMYVAIIAGIFSYIIMDEILESILVSFIDNPLREITFYEIYSDFSVSSLIPILAGVIILVIVQFKDYSKNNVAHFLTSLPVTNAQVYGTKLLVGAITIALYFDINFIVTLFLRNKNIGWMEQMNLHGLDEMFNGVGVIFQQALFNFLIILMLYFFLVLMQYIVTNVYASAVLGGLAICAISPFSFTFYLIEDIYNLYSAPYIGDNILFFIETFFIEPLYYIPAYEAFGEAFKANVLLDFVVISSIIVFLFMSIKCMSEKEGLKISQNLIVTKWAKWTFKIVVTYFMFFIPMLFGLELTILNIAVATLGYFIANKISKA